MIHHIALGTPNVRELFNFYVKLPHSKLANEWREEDGSLRSIWIEMGGFTLMIEKGEKMAPRALVLTFKSVDRSYWEEFMQETNISHRTDYTVYFKDPDGNTIGISSYPEVISL